MRLPLVIKSFAKLNLYLQVLNKRKDNFHNLNTLFSRIDLADTIILKERKDNLIKIKCNSRQVPKDKTNLCWQAAALLRKEFKLENNGLASNSQSHKPQGNGLASDSQSHKPQGNGLASDSQSHKLKPGLEIEIKKRIPVGAGLGGGSSNAASVLSGLNRYWKLNLPKTKLLDLAAKIGSDVPFFICDTKFALGSNRGDKIKPLASLQQLKLWFILVHPNLKVSTPLIYQKFDCFSGLTIPRHNVNILISELSKKGFRAKAEYLFNSLEAVTTRLYPVVNQIKNALYAMGLEKVIMSGSGPTVFAICGSLKQAQAMSRKLRKKYKSWQIFVSSTA